MNRFDVSMAVARRAMLVVAPALLLMLWSLSGGGPATAQASLAPAVIWAAPIGTTDTAEDEADGISVDSDGNTVVSGVFRGEISLGKETFQSRGEGDIFLVSYSPGGVVRWARQLGGPGDENTFDLKTDGSGNIVASGWFTGDVDFGGIPLSSAGSTDMFLLKFNSKGKALWARSFGGPLGDGGNELDVLPDGRMAVAGISAGGFTVGDRTYPFGGGSRDSYAMRLDSSGKVKWVREFNGPGTERIRAIDINSDGQVFVGFQYRVSVQTEAFSQISRGGWDGALAKLSRTGTPAWLLPFGSVGEDNVRGLASGPDGSVYASGLFHGPAVLADRQIEDIGGLGDDYLMRVSSEGDSGWLVTVAGAGIGTGGEIRSDGYGVVMSSLVSGDLEIAREGRSVGSFGPPGGNPTSYLAGFTPAGELRFNYSPEAIGFGSAALGDVLGISPDGRYIAQAVRFRGTLQAGETSLNTESQKDSAVIYLRTDVPAPSPARLKIMKVAPPKLKLRKGADRKVTFKIRNRGEIVAKKVKLCPQTTRSLKKKIRVPSCRRVGSIRGGAARKVRLRISARQGGGASRRASLKVELKSKNAASRTVRIRIRLLG